MDILITGAAGFVGKNLTAAMECIRDGKDRTHPGLVIDKIYRYDIDSSEALLEEACRKADFVFHLAATWITCISNIWIWTIFYAVHRFKWFFW